MADNARDITELVPNIGQGSGRSVEFWLDFGIIVGAAFVVTVGFVIWAKFFRKRRRRRSSKAIQIMGNDHERDDSEEEHSRRHRRHGHGERYTKRNPTLAQTGGLPPLRPDPDEPSQGMPPSAGQLPS
ncbi:MAG TPA: hypothetical protein VI454_17915 [Verrucomicrobiae bacterium]